MGIDQVSEAWNAKSSNHVESSNDLAWKHSFSIFQAIAIRDSVKFWNKLFLVHMFPRILFEVAATVFSSMILIVFIFFNNLEKYCFQIKITDSWSDLGTRSQSASNNLQQLTEIMCFVDWKSRTLQRGKTESVKIFQKKFHFNILLVFNYHHSKTWLPFPIFQYLISISIIPKLDCHFQCFNIWFQFLSFQNLISISIFPKLYCHSHIAF